MWLILGLHLMGISGILTEEDEVDGSRRIYE
jgi:hypothetical protein